VSKFAQIGHYKKTDGEDLDWEVIVSIQKEEREKEIKRLFNLLEINPAKLTLEELVLLLRLQNLPTSPNSIKLDFADDGYFTCKRNLNIILELHDYTKAFLYSISHMITHDGRLKYGNNKIVPNISRLKEKLNISDKKWATYIKPDVEKFNIIVKEQIDKRWCLLLNPLFATTTRTFTETMFIAFHKDLKKYLHPIEYLYLKKFYSIEI